MHWVLDVVFREDELQVTDPDGAAQLALCNWVALSIIRQYTNHKDGVNGKCQCDDWGPNKG